MKDIDRASLARLVGRIVTLQGVAGVAKNGPRLDGVGQWAVEVQGVRNWHELSGKTVEVTGRLVLHGLSSPPVGRGAGVGAHRPGGGEAYVLEAAAWKEALATGQCQS